MNIETIKVLNDLFEEYMSKENQQALEDAFWKYVWQQTPWMVSCQGRKARGYIIKLDKEIFDMCRGFLEAISDYDQPIGATWIYSKKRHDEHRAQVYSKTVGGEEVDIKSPEMLQEVLDMHLEKGWADEQIDLSFELYKLI